MFRLLSRTIASYMPHLIPNAALGLSSKLASVCSPVFVGVLINNLTDDATANKLMVALGGVVACLFVCIVLDYCFECSMSRAANRMSAAMRCDYFHRFCEAPLHEIDAEPSSTWAQKLSYNIGTVVNACRNLLNLALSLAGYAAASAYIILEQSFCFLPVLMLLVLGSIMLHRNMKDTLTVGAGCVRRAYYSIITYVTDQLGVLPLRRVQKAPSTFGYDAANEELRISNTHFELQGIKFRFSINVLTWCIHTILFGICVYLWWKGEIGIGGIVTCHLLLSQMFGGIFMVTDILPVLDAGAEMAESLLKLPSGSDAKQSENHSARCTDEGISIENLCFRWPEASQAILNGLNLSVKSGECICMFGANGSGKSTLIKILSGLYPAGSGACSHGYGHVGYVPHTSTILHDTLLENVRLQNQAFSEQQVRDVLTYCPIPEMDAEHQLYQQLTPHSLSDGQKQCLGLARALLYRPQLLFVDEVTHSLDASMKQCVYDRLFALKQRCAIFSISHELPPQGLFDRYFLLRNGRLQEVSRTDIMDWLKEGGCQ